MRTDASEPHLTDTYEKVVTSLPNGLAYAISGVSDGGATITILHVIHGARDWPIDEWPS